MAEHLTSNCLKSKGMIAEVVLRSDSRQETIREGDKFEYELRMEVEREQERKGEGGRGIRPMTYISFAQRCERASATELARCRSAAELGELGLAPQETG